MRITILISIISLLSIYSSFSQEIRIGQKAEDVLSLVKYQVSRYNTPDSYGKHPKDKVRYEVVYDNGKIKSVIIERLGTLIIPLHKTINYSIHYQMSEGYLNYITKVYPTLSRQEVTTLQEKVSHKLKTENGEYYLSNDLKGCEFVYLNTSNQPCVKYFEEGMYTLELKKAIEETKTRIITIRKKKEIDSSFEDQEEDRSLSDAIKKWQNTQSNTDSGNIETGKVGDEYSSYNGEDLSNGVTNIADKEANKSPQITENSQEKDENLSDAIKKWQNTQSSDLKRKNYHASGYNNGGSLGKGVSYSLALTDRDVIKLPQITKNYQKEGTVVVDIIVDRKGNVIHANPGARGSTTLNSKLYELAKEVAMNTIFKANPGADEEQKGQMTLTFTKN